MPKNNRDYDSVFKTLKNNHKRLFVSVINKTFNKNYPSDTIPVVLPTDSFIENPDNDTIEERESDLLFDICGDTFLLECQSYEDGSMAIRIAEYAFLSARRTAVWKNGSVKLDMPDYAVIYVRSNKNTPLYTRITFDFPNNKSVTYDSKNILLRDYSKEEIIENRLIPYIPFYITRYEDIILNHGDITDALNDLKYFRDNLINLYNSNELLSEELLDIMSYINRIICHITDGNEFEERMVSVMGGNIEETPSQALKRTTLEKTALSLFTDGVTFDIVRRSVPFDIIDDDRLKDIMEMASQTV